MFHEESKHQARWQKEFLTAKECRKGFYAYDDINAVKAMAVFIRKYGKKELLKTMDKLHKEHDFEKIQEVLGNDLEEGLKILEETKDR